jgi:uncharacterized protein
MGVIQELELGEIERLLSTSPVARIGCCAHGADGDGRPYVVPLAYGYDGKAIYAHSAVGKKIRLMRAEPRVTVEVDDVQSSDRWKSVIAEGTYKEIVDADERRKALAIVYSASTRVPDLPPETVVFRIMLTDKAGRFEVPD